MRAKRAHALRTAERPNPGRKHGGASKAKKAGLPLMRWRWPSRDDIKAAASARQREERGY